MGTEGSRPSRRRLPDARLLVAGVLGLAAIAVILVLVLGTGSGQSLLPSTPISNAALDTSGEPGFRFVLGANVTLGARKIATVTDGSVAQRPKLDASLVTNS